MDLSAICHCGILLFSRWILGVLIIFSISPDVWIWFVEQTTTEHVSYSSVFPCQLIRFLAIGSLELRYQAFTVKDWWVVQIFVR